MAGNSKQRKEYFTPMQIGYITNCVMPVNIDSDSRWKLIEKSDPGKSGDPDIGVIPLERHGTIMGIIRREDIKKLDRNQHSLAARIFSKSSPSFIMPVHNVIDASSHITKVAEEGLKTIAWDNPGWYVVQHKHKYYGIVNLRQLIIYLQEIQSRDLTRAGEIQKTLLIQPELEDSRFRYLSYNRMAHEVGGDWFKPLQINRDLYLFSCFDVAGKNISGSLVTMSLGACLATLSLVSYHEGITGRRKKDNPEQITSLVNNLIMTVNPPDVFVAGTLLYVNLYTELIEIYNCGLSPVIAFVPSGNNTIAYKNFKPNLPPLGLQAELNPDPPQKIPISDGLRILVYSDGLLDMSDINGERYGEERVIDFFQNLHYIPDDDFSAFVDREINLWTKDTALADDITLCELRFGKAEPGGSR